MPFDATYGARGVEVHFIGRCDGAEVLDAHERIYIHRYEEGFQYVIADFSRVEFLDVATADLLRIAEHDRQYLLRNPGYLLVVIAPQAPVAGLIRTFQHFMEGTSLRAHLTSTREAAMAWLRSEMLASA
jgi:anti-anti-sigma regulatory factor